MTSRLEKGDTAPSVSLPITPDGSVDISRPTAIGRIIYFYPRDNTPGCTLEGQEFSRLLPEFQSLGIDILGISKDSLKKHANFIEKQSLLIPLASDANGVACEAFGVWVEKKMYGRVSMGIERSTFLILQTGTIAAVWRKVKVKGHAEEVLKTARGLLETEPD